MIDYAATRFREEVTLWPDGVYEADAYVDHDPLGNPDIHLHVKITVDGDDLTIDFTGSRHPPGDPGLVDLRQHPRVHGRPDRRDDGPRDPQERGLLRPDQPGRPPGLRPQPASRASRSAPAPTTPAPTSARSSRSRCSTCCPTRPCRRPTRPASRRSSSASTPAPASRSPTTRPRSTPAGATPSKGMDAWGAQNASFGNLWKATAEINESLFPHVQWSRDYRTDSGGAGQWRGLCGSHYEKEVLVDAKVYTYVVGMKYPMPGICGGQPRRPERDDHPLRHRRPLPGGAHRRLGPDRRRRAHHVRLRRRRRLGRPARPRPASRARRRARRVRQRRGRRDATTASCSPARSTTSPSPSTTAATAASRRPRDC